MLEKKQHQAFAEEIAKGTKTADAYLIAYPNCKNRDSAGSAGRRLLKQEEIKNEIVRLRSEIVQAREQAIKDEVQKAARGRFLTYDLKRQILHDIAQGKKTKVGTKNGKPVYKIPTPQDQIKAIELDNEMTGDGFRPPEPPTPEGQGGNTFNGPVYNTVIRKTVFKTRETTARGQTFQIQPNEES